ncbi:hypothetical protein [Actinoplanes sp. L3-i22]|uniref:hypothetical protein n=1 Tax=Actinoplanes sp. L3-i22 TaxID=2836373 RepID=UPI001C741346|nr:hypothetical protein [Actinoplanes sp. L3-i22]BCY11013.1 hypothetical protein L3i22_061010 [Actinoplanes sp. L3-i22]
MEIRTIGGQAAIDRRGVAERLGLSVSTVRMLSTPLRRAVTGFPEPLPERFEDRDWFSVASVDAFQAVRPVPVRHLPAGDPDELLDVAALAQLRGVATATISAYVKLSLNAWEDGQDGYLPFPDDIEPARRGNTYRWTRAHAIGWLVPERPRRGGRTPGRAPTVADLEAVLSQPGGLGLKNRDVAAALSARLDGRPVSVQVVQRLKRRARGPSDV